MKAQVNFDSLGSGISDIETAFEFYYTDSKNMLIFVDYDYSNNTYHETLNPAQGNTYTSGQYVVVLDGSANATITTSVSGKFLIVTKSGFSIESKSANDTLATILANDTCKMAIILKIG